MSMHAPAPGLVSTTTATASTRRSAPAVRLPATVALLSTFVLTGCAGAPSFGTELTTAITESRGGTVALAEVEGVHGTAFLVICPYETTASVEERLGFDWPDAPDLSQTDDRQVIAVIHDDSVSATAALPRDTIDFCSTGAWDVLPIGTELDVSETGDDDAVLVTIANP